MPMYGGSPFILTVDEGGAGIEVINERNHSAGYGAECTLEQFLNGYFDTDVKQYLGEETLAKAYAAARELLAKKQSHK